MDDLSHPVILCLDHRANDAESKLLRSVLEKAGYRVLSASTAEGAVEILRQLDVHLILMEQRMPTGFSGESLAQQLKEMKPDVPLAIYTADWAQSSEDLRVADAFITKLVSVEELLSILEKLLCGVRERDKFLTTPGSGDTRDRSAA
jgi:CheY-like chemotaxis protein